MVRKTDNQKLPRRCVDIVEGTQCVVEGVSQDITVSPGYMGRMIESGSILRISVPASSRIGVLVFWAHDWSGLAVVDNGEYRSELDLYHPIAGCHHLVLNELHFFVAQTETMLRACKITLGGTAKVTISAMLLRETDWNRMNCHTRSKSWFSV